MQKLVLLSSAVVGALALSPPTSAQSLLIAGRDTSGGRVLRFDADDGSIEDADFILIPDPPGPGRERMPIEPGLSDPPFPGPMSAADQEVWTTDKDFHLIYRHQSQGSCALQEYAESELEDPRGYAFVNGDLYVTDVTALQGGVIKKFSQGDPTPEVDALGFEPYDVIGFTHPVDGGILLISDAMNGAIKKVDYDGTVLGDFITMPTTPLTQPRQLYSPDGVSGVAVAGSGGPNPGLFFYFPNGVEAIYLPVLTGTTCTEVNGLYMISGTLWIWTCSQGVFLYDITAGQSFAVPGTPVFNAQYIRFFEPAPTLGASYCQATINSSGCEAFIWGTGSASVAANDLVLECQVLPPNQFGVFFYSGTPVEIPFGNGFRCVGGQIARLAIENSGPDGVITHALDNTNPPFPAVQITSGSTWYFSTWYRDPLAGGAFFNLSNGFELTFEP